MIPRLSVTSPHALETGQLARLVLLLVAVAVLDDVHAHADGAALLEAGLGPVGVAGPEVDEEVELGVGAVAKHGHVSLPESWGRGRARRGRRRSPRAPRRRCRCSSHRTPGPTSGAAMPAPVATHSRPCRRGGQLADRDVSTVVLAVDDVPAPVVQLGRAREGASEDDGGPAMLRVGPAEHRERRSPTRAGRPRRSRAPGRRSRPRSS